MTTEKFKQRLTDLKVPIKSISPERQECDANIELGGKYSGMSIQVSELYGYYNIVKELPNSTFVFIHGMGQFEYELEKCLTY